MDWYFKLKGCFTISLQLKFIDVHLTNPTDAHIQRVRFAPSAVQYFGCQFHPQAFPPGLTSEGTGWNRVVRHRYPLEGLSLVLYVIVGGALLSPEVTWLWGTVLIGRKTEKDLATVKYVFLSFGFLTNCILSLNTNYKLEIIVTIMLYDIDIKT